MRVCNDAGNVIETHEHKGDFQRVLNLLLNFLRARIRLLMRQAPMGEYNCKRCVKSMLDLVCSLTTSEFEIDVCGLLGFPNGELGPAVISRIGAKPEITSMKRLIAAAISQAQMDWPDSKGQLRTKSQMAFCVSTSKTITRSF